MTTTTMTTNAAMFAMRAPPPPPTTTTTGARRQRLPSLHLSSSATSHGFRVRSSAEASTSAGTTRNDDTIDATIADGDLNVASGDARVDVVAARRDGEALVVDYVVRKVDTLYDVARAHGTSTTSIAEASALGVRRTIEVGQTLRVPVDIEHASYGVRVRLLGEEAALALGTIGTTPAAKKKHVPNALQALGPKSLKGVQNIWASATTHSKVSSTLLPTKVLGVGTILMIGVLVASVKAETTKKKIKINTKEKAPEATPTIAVEEIAPEVQVVVTEAVVTPTEEESTEEIAGPLEQQEAVKLADEAAAAVVIVEDIKDDEDPVMVEEVSEAQTPEIVVVQRDMTKMTKATVPTKPTPRVKKRSSATVPGREYDLADYGTAVPTFIGAFLLVIERSIPERFRIWKK